MRFLIAAAVVIILLVVKMVWSMSRKYKRLLADEHIVELLGLIPTLKAAAIELAGEPLKPEDDPRTVITKAGLAVFYSIQASEEEKYVHHLSFSYAGAPMAFAAGGRFLHVVLNALGTIENLKWVAHTGAGVTHGVFLLSDIQELAYTGAVLPVPNADEVRTLNKAATNWLDSIRETGEVLDSEEELLARVGASEQA